MSNPIVEQLRTDVPQPVFNPTVVPVQVDENTLHIRGGPWNGPVLTLSSPGEQGVVETLVDLIESQKSTDEILDRFEAANHGKIAKVLYRLYEVDAIYDRTELADRSLYNHHAIKSTFRGTERDHLSSTTVGVVNAGQIGSYVAEHLLEMGVGDVRYLEPTDRSGRRPAVDEDDRFGRADTDEVAELVDRADFVVYTADRPFPDVESTINEAAHRTETPWVVGQLEGYDGHVGPAIFPGQTPCLECFRTRVAANATNPEGLRAYRDADHPTGESGEWVTLPPFAHAVASLLSMDLVHLLLYGTGYTVGRAIWMNSIDFSFDADRVLKLPRCEVCGAEPASGDTPFMTLDDAAEVADIEVDLSD